MNIKKYYRNKYPQLQTIILPAIWEKYNIPGPIPEYQFCLERRWRIDYAWPNIGYGIALEIEGGIYKGGRHISPKGFIKDMEKYNKMAEYGWILLRYEPNHIDFFQIRNTINKQRKRIYCE